MRLLFTVLSGNARKPCTDYLRNQGHPVLNVDLIDLDNDGVQAADMVKLHSTFRLKD